MTQAPQPLPDGSRIGPFSLASLDLVDAPPERPFDALTRLAARILNTPVSLISIVEESRDRQFFKSQVGLPEPWAQRRQTPLSHSFCQHVKRDGQPLVVACATEHDLVRDNLAIRDLGVVAYLGVPVFDPDGAALGALCVIDATKREWTDRDVAIMQDIAGCVSDEIHLRAALRTNELLHESLVATHDRACRYTAMSESIGMAFMAPDLPVDERFQLLLQAGCRAMGVESGTIARVTCGSTEVLFRHGMPGMAQLPPPDETLAAPLLSGTRLCFHDDTDVTASRGHLSLAGLRTRAYIGAPLMLNGALFGVLEFTDPAPRTAAWSEEEMSIVSIVSMFACSFLGVYGQIEALRQSERGLISELVALRHENVPA